MSDPSQIGHSDWIERAAQVRPSGAAFIDGERRPARDGETFPSTTPRDGTELTQLAAGKADDVDAAVGAAHRAFDDGRWARMAPRRRKEVMGRWAEAIRADLGDLALLESLDVGKPIGEALRVDVPSAAECIQWYGEAIDKIYGEVGPVADTELAFVTREPVGVVGAIVPWNYPLIISAWKLAPAIAAGNSVVLKPAEDSTLSALRLAELASDAGLPDGVLNVVPGRGPEAGAALAAHHDVDALAFTGSGSVGRSLMGHSAASNAKPVVLELGGKSAHIVLADCPDLDAAADAVAWGFLYNVGQTCNAGSRLVLDRPIAEEFLEMVAERARTILPGDPLHPDTQVGSLVSDTHLERVHGWVERAVAEGATVLTGGRRADVVPGGQYYEPTVLTDVDNSDAIARNEVFGPVLAVITVDGPDEALAVANDSPYGLAGAVWTTDLSTGHRLARRLRAGTVWVNTFDATDVALPFGGFKASGHGRDKSLHAFDAYTHLKTTWIHHG